LLFGTQKPRGHTSVNSAEAGQLVDRKIVRIFWASASYPF
jgi:hypothetical protein